jgi:hypothetical protein
MVTVWCDNDAPDPGAGVRACPAHTTPPTAWTVREARAGARVEGWRYVPGHPASGPGRDLCPEHARESAR